MSNARGFEYECGVDPDQVDARPRAGRGPDSDNMAWIGTGTHTGVIDTDLTVEESSEGYVVLADVPGFILPAVSL
jgi:HSP20 family molecular chaperone IbpA